MNLKSIKTYLFLLVLLTISVFFYKYSQIETWVRNYIVISKMKKESKKLVLESSQRLSKLSELHKSYKQPSKERIKIVKKLANEGFDLALCDLGSYHISGQHGVEKNFDLGAQLIEKGFKISIGEYARESKRFEYLKCPTSKASSKDFNLPLYNYYLGYAYLIGDKFLQRDIKKGLFYLKKTALSKINDNYSKNIACLLLTQAYLFGKYGVLINVEEGLKYALQSADRKEPWAQYTLGEFYLDPGNRHNREKGISYLKLAIENTSATPQIKSAA